VHEDQPPCYGQEAAAVLVFRLKCLSGRALAGYIQQPMTFHDHNI